MGKKGVMSLLHSSFMRVSELLNPREIFFRKKPSHHFMSLHSWHFWHYYSNPFSSYFAFSCSFDDHGNHGCSRKRSIFVGKSTSNAAVTINSQKNQINFVIYVPFAYGNFLINVAVVDRNSTANALKAFRWTVTILIEFVELQWILGKIDWLMSKKWYFLSFWVEVEIMR